MKNILVVTAMFAAAGCSCAPSPQDAGPDALWGDRMNAYRGLADAKAAAVEIDSSPFASVRDTSSDAYNARRKALRDEVGHAQARLDQAECALDRARR